MKKSNDALDRKQRFKHEQHTKKFYWELNSPKQDIQQPFRISDEKWLIGKHKGKTLNETPEYYIKWILSNFNNLSNTHRTILNNKIK